MSSAFQLQGAVLGAALAFLAGCNVSSSTGNASNALLQTAPTLRNNHGRSWMLAEAKGATLMYAAARGWSYAFTYPQGKLVGTLDYPAEGLCSDGSGNIFIPSGSNVYEFRHGGTSPIATLALPSPSNGCAVDPLTETLAVIVFGSGGVGVALFRDESGEPTLISTALTPYTCGYDNQGDLFVDGILSQSFAMAELPHGSGTFTALSVSPTIYENPGQVQWDGKNMTVEVGAWEPKRDGVTPEIDRLAISGSSATVIGTTQFKGIRKLASYSWVDGDRVIVPYATSGGVVPNIGYWGYPKGGEPARRIPKPVNKETTLNGIALSAP